MSDQNPRSRRRRIAGETPAPAPAKPAAPLPKKRAPKKEASPESAAPAAPAAKPARPKPPSSRVAAAVAARDTGAPTPTPSPKPASVPSSPTPEVAGPSETDATPRPPLLGLIGSVALLLAGGALAVLGFLHWQSDGSDSLREDAVSSASDAAETIFSFSYDDLDGHATEAKALMTAKFAKEYDTIAPALDDLAPQRKVEVVAQVRNAAALPCGDDCSDTKASVLVFLDQDRRLADDDTATVFGNRIVVDLVKSGDDWKVDGIRAL